MRLANGVWTLNSQSVEPAPFYFYRILDPLLIISFFLNMDSLSGFQISYSSQYICRFLLILTMINAFNYTNILLIYALFIRPVISGLLHRLFKPSIFSVCFSFFQFKICSGWYPWHFYGSPNWVPSNDSFETSTILNKWVPVWCIPRAVYSERSLKGDPDAAECSLSVMLQ